VTEHLKDLQLGTEAGRLVVVDLLTRYANDQTGYLYALSGLLAEVTRAAVLVAPRNDGSGETYAKTAFDVGVRMACRSRG
jgi:hypothetical protein